MTIMLKPYILHYLPHKFTFQNLCTGRHYSKTVTIFLWCIQIIIFCHEKYKETDSLKGSLQKEMFLYNSSVKKVDHVTFGNVNEKSGLKRVLHYTF